MSSEADLLQVVLALQMGFVTKEQVVECGALWAEDRMKPLTAPGSDLGNSLRGLMLAAIPSRKSGLALDFGA